MTEAFYWWVEAAKFKQVAQVAEDHAQQTELLELAKACEAVAISVERRTTSD
jgi:hypothetical protein